MTDDELFEPAVVRLWTVREGSRQRAEMASGSVPVILPMLLYVFVSHWLSGRTLSSEAFNIGQK
jgi:hypothetical protein